MFWFLYVFDWPLVPFSFNKMESVQNFANQGPICCPKHTHSREEVIVKFLVCDVVVVQVSFFHSFIGCGRNSLLVFNQSFLCRYFAVKRIGFFVLFVLCVRMKVWLHFIALKWLKITWFLMCIFLFFIYITYRFKCRDKINASFCIFISSSLSFQVTFKAFYSSLLLENECSFPVTFIQKLRAEELGLIPQDRELFGSV